MFYTKSPTNLETEPHSFWIWNFVFHGLNQSETELETEFREASLGIYPSSRVVGEAVNHFYISLVSNRFFPRFSVLKTLKFLLSRKSRVLFL